MSRGKRLELGKSLELCKNLCHPTKSTDTRLHTTVPRGSRWIISEGEPPGMSVGCPAPLFSTFLRGEEAPELPPRPSHGATRTPPPWRRAEALPHAAPALPDRHLPCPTPGPRLPRAGWRLPAGPQEQPGRAERGRGGQREGAAPRERGQARPLASPRLASARRSPPALPPGSLLEGAGRGPRHHVLPQERLLPPGGHQNPLGSAGPLPGPAARGLRRLRSRLVSGQGQGQGHG